ncbi:2Fe-2S iron-sulfur cluster-binding protein [Streptomyces sp. NPDC002851]
MSDDDIERDGQGGHGDQGGHGGHGGHGGQAGHGGWGDQGSWGAGQDGWSGGGQDSWDGQGGHGDWGGQDSWGGQDGWDGQDGQDSWGGWSGGQGEQVGPSGPSGPSGPMGPVGPAGAVGWQPTPHQEYDADATAFVQLPEGGFPDRMTQGTTPTLSDFDEATPLAAPGAGGYVPPHISVAPGAATDPAATGMFVVPTMGPTVAAAAAGEQTGGQAGGQAGEQQPSGASVQWPEPNAPQPPAPEAHEPGTTGHWSFTAEPEPTPVADVTGEWSIPVATGELPDESGEFTQSSLVEQWGGNAPATLPGGAPAPWAEDVREEVPEPVQDVPVQEEAVQEAPVLDVPPALVEPVQEEPAHEEPAQEEPAQKEEPTEEEPVHGEAPAAQPQEDVQEDVEAVEETQEAAPAEPAPEEAAPAEPAQEEPAPAAPSLEEAPSADPAAPAEPAEPADPAAPATPTLNDQQPLVSYVLRVNGADRPVTDAWIGESLLYVLRERLGLAGAKDGCSQGECGACAVQVDGRLVASCLVPAATTAGSEVRTVEGLAADGQPSDVQRALAAGTAVQCGFCVPGMAMTLHDLLAGNPAPTERETRQALCGNLCRCSGYRGVLDAVREVVAEREATRAAEATTDETADDGTAHRAADGTDDTAASTAPTAPAPVARIPHQAPPGEGGAHPDQYPYPHHSEDQDGGMA